MTRTNYDFFSDVIPVDWIQYTDSSKRFIVAHSSDPTTGGFNYNSTMVFTFSSVKTSIGIDVYYDNVNWMLGVKGIYGFKCS